MTIYLVRHSLAVPRKQWVGDDDDRPLTKRGLAQSEVLARWSKGLTLTSVQSSPSRRCLDTVGGIAAVHDLTVLIRDELAISGRHLAKDLVAALLADDLDVLVCTHGENVLPILRGVRPATISGPKKSTAKGSVWALTRGKRGMVASYMTNTALARLAGPP